ncbi:MAG: hypothetical protein FD124_2276 [Alphaproteobacteria bacterium]|nr:MAG: hypothetical protein FD124_2276 [Alphaproteobacteria bacterium]
MKSMIAEHADLGRASAWARRVHAALDGWEIARRVRWSTWEGGELLLEIETAPTGIPCERVSIVATADRIGFLTRTFGLQVPLPGQTLERAVEDVKALTRKWFAGEVVIASYWGEGQWRGSTMVDTRQQTVSKSRRRFSTTTRSSRSP